MNIALYGTGKMGRAIEEVALKRGHSIGLKVNASNTGTAPTGMDVAIEFSKPDDHRIFFQYTDTVNGGRRIEAYTELLGEFGALSKPCQ